MLSCLDLSWIQCTHGRQTRHFNSHVKIRPTSSLKEGKRKKPIFAFVRLTRSDNKTRVPPTWPHGSGAAQKPPGSAGACLSFISASSCSFGPRRPSSGGRPGHGITRLLPRPRPLKSPGLLGPIRAPAVHVPLNSPYMLMRSREDLGFSCPISAAQVGETDGRTAVARVPGSAAFKPFINQAPVHRHELLIG